MPNSHNDLNRKIYEEGKKAGSILSNGLLQSLGENVNFDYRTDPLVSGATLMHQARSYPISNNRQLLTDVYFADGTLQNIINMPIDDAFKGIMKINSGELDSDEMQDLLNDVEENVIEPFKQAAKWASLYGGGGVVIETDGDASDPLDIKKEIRKGQHFQFYAADLWELNMVNMYTYAEEKPYVPDPNISVPFNFYGVLLNQSRVFKMYGKIAPSFKRQILRGWGMSEIERIISPYSQYIKYQNVLFEMLDESKISTFYVHGMEAAATNAEARAELFKAIQEMNDLKNYKRAVVMPVDSKFEQVEVNYSWLESALNAIKNSFACSVGFPQNKLFGDGASGFSSGADVLETYNLMVEGRRKTYIPTLKDMIRLRCQYLFGFMPQDIQIEFPSLRVLSPEQEQVVKNHELERLLRLYDRGGIPMKEVLKQSNLNNLTPIEIEDMTTEDFPPPPMRPERLDLDKMNTKA